MTEEPKFQVPPPPPKAPAFGGPAPVPGLATTKAESKASSDIPANNFAATLKLSPRIFETKIMAAILGGCIVVGMLLGMIFFGGSSAAPQQAAPQDCLIGVVPNLDVRERLKRCGVVPNTSPCWFYAVNHSRNDKYAESFFEEAAKLTGRAPYRVRIENQGYAKTIIPHGHIAKIKIPALR